MVNLDCSREVEITAKIMVVCLILLLLAVLFVVFLHLYVNRFLRRLRVEEPPLPTAPGSRRRRRPHGHSVINLDFTDPGEESMQMGLDPAVLRSLPIVIMEAKDFEDGGLECCAVCLSEVEPGEKARLLPSCNHVFHVDCIDLWFLSHSTCPLCRYSVAPQNIHQSPQENSANSFGYATESHPNFPTNVLFWGDQSRVLSSNGYNNNGSCLGTEFSTRTPPSSSSPPASSSLPDQLAPQSSSSASSSSSSPDARPEQILMIDVPPQLMSHSFAEDEFKSPTVTNCRSLKTLLMGEKNGAT